jgi:hypothetical protein
MRLLILLVWSILLLSGCPGTVQPKPTPIPVDTNWCGRAQVSLHDKECRDRRGDLMWRNRLGEEFKETCERAQREGVIFLNPRCVAEAKSCEEANKCPTL